MEQERKKTIDELFQQKFSDFEFEQKEANWQFMKHLLNEQKKKKTLLFRFRLIFSIVSVICIAFLFINKPWSETNYQKNYLKEKKITEKKSNDKIEAATETTSRKKLPIQESSERNITSNETLKSKGNFSDSFSIEDNSFNKYTNTTDLIISKSETTIHPYPLEENMEKEYIPSYLESSVKTAYMGKDSVKTIITNMGQQLNSPFSDYAPVINADGTEMYFTSRRPTTEKEKKRKKESMENIYYSNFHKSRKKWSSAIKMPSPVNTPNRFNSIIALSNDGQQMLLYRDDKYGNGDIYESILNGKDWSDPKKLPEPINSEHIETSASISPDGRTLYFVSNRSGGKGGLDIWYCTKNLQGEWGKATNLEEINTPLNEEGVFIHPDGKTLYFSSRGHEGMGGYDIFTSIYEKGRWTKPVNLGSDINTSEDDVYFVMEANGKTAYYTSAKKDGFGEKDIYKVDLITPTTKDEKVGQLTLFKGIVLDKKSSQPLEAVIEIIDVEENEIISQFKSNKVTGNFLISLPSGKNYGINVKKEGYLFFSENMNIPENASYKEIIKTVLLDKLTPGSRIVLKNIFYDYDKATLRKSSINELDRLYELMIQNPQLKIELSAHTDSRGSAAYNLNLSQERAQSCLDYLIKKGINKDRLVAKGYGEQRLVITDEAINKMNSEVEKENAHQENRRTEIKIIENG